MAESGIMPGDRPIVRNKWPLFFFVALAFIITSYIVDLKDGFTDHAMTSDMLYGIVGICMVIFLSFYKLRLNIYRIRLGSMQAWLQAHIYIGLICAALIFIHSGFHFHWNFSSFLFLLFLLVVVSGIIGALIYKTIPLSIAKYGKEVITYERVIDGLQQYYLDAEKSISNTSDEFKKVYEKHIKPLFQSKEPDWKYLMMEEQELLNKRKQTFELLKKTIPANEVYDLNILCTILIEREKLAFKGSKLKLLRIWLNIHMPLVFAMLTAAVFHILSIVYF